MKKTVYGFVLGLAAFVLGAGFFACDTGAVERVLGGNNQDPAGFVAVTDITLPVSAGVAGTVIDLSGAAVVPADATYTAIVWTASGAGLEGTGSVSGNKVTPLAEGTLALTATIAKGAKGGAAFTKDFEITVIAANDFVAVTGITGVPGTGTQGAALDLGAVAVAPEDATVTAIVWSVAEDSGIDAEDVDIIEGGTVTPNAAGTLKLTATVAGGAADGADYTQDFEITINGAFIAVTGISGVPTGMVLGDVLDLSGAAAVPSHATNTVIAWTVTDAGTTGVNGLTEGKATPSATGTLKLRATVAGGAAGGTDFTKDFTVKVNAAFVAVTDIAGVPETGTAGTAIDLSGVTVTPDTATNTAIEWSKAAGSVNVSINGTTATPQAAGALKLTATIANGKTATTAYTKTFTITVEAAFVAVQNITGVPATVTVGTAIDLGTAAVVPSNATNKTVTWTVTSAGTTGVTAGAVANGTVTPSAEGTLTLTATVAGGLADGTDYTQEFTVEVTAAPAFVAVTGITGVPETGTAGTAISLSGAAVTPSTATSKTITWTVKNAGTTGAATGAVTGNTVTPPAEGTLTLTATVANGATETTAFTKDFTVTVSTASAFVAVTGITGISTGSRVVGQNVSLGGATVQPANATNQTIVWSVAADSAEAVISGTVAATKAAGTLKLTATVANGLAQGTPYTQTFAITVTSAAFVAVSNITGVSTAAVTAGTAISLSGATVVPDTATNQTIAWTASGAGLSGTVSGNTVTPTEAGTLTLTATVANGKTNGTEDYTKTFTITVNAAPSFVAVTGITGVSTADVTVGTAISLSGATVVPDTATNQTITWTASGAGLPQGTVSGSVTPTAEGTLTLTATIANGATASSDFTQTFTITVNAGGGSGGGSDLTAEVTFGQTTGSSDVTVGTPDGDEDDAVVNMTIGAVEKSTVYFTASKTAGQTISASGDDANAVTVHTSDTVDGTVASETDAVVAVDTRGLVFDGGSSTFALDVTEADKDPRKINITLNVTANQTGAALFTVTHDDDGEILTRVDTGTPAAFDGFLNAFKWLEKNAEAQTEYLVRVEKEETLPRLVVSLNNAENVTLRLRGAGGVPRVLKPQDAANIQVVNEKTLDVDQKAFIQINSPYENKGKKTLVLDDNITIQGRVTSAGGNEYQSLFAVGVNATFILEKGALITKHDSSSYTGASAVIRGYREGSTVDPVNYGAIRLRGGSITDCSVYNHDNPVVGTSTGRLIYMGSRQTNYQSGSFELAGGNQVTLNGNNNNKVLFSGDAVFDLDPVNGMSLPE